MGVESDRHLIKEASEEYPTKDTSKSERNELCDREASRDTSFVIPVAYHEVYPLEPPRRRAAKTSLFSDNWVRRRTQQAYVV